VIIWKYFNIINMLSFGSLGLYDNIKMILKGLEFNDTEFVWFGQE